MEYILGIDIGGTNIKFGVVNEQGVIASQKTCPTPKHGSEIVLCITQYVSEYLKMYELLGVGISAPGIVDEKGYMITGGAIQDFYEFDLRAVLTQRLKLPVTVENDANCAILAEKWLGKGSEHRDYLMFVIGTGVGGSIVINNQLYRGANHSAGEFGFIFVKNPYDTDARRASLSLVASVQTGLVNAYAARTSIIFSGEEIYERFNDDEDARVVITQFHHNLGRGIYDAIVAYNPEIVIIGGAISSNSFFIEALNDTVAALHASHRDLSNVEFPKIVASTFKNDAGIIGAAFKMMEANRHGS